MAAMPSFFSVTQKTLIFVQGVANILSGIGQMDCVFSDESEDNEAQEEPFGVQRRRRQIIFCSRTHSQLSQFIGASIRPDSRRLCNEVAR